MRPKPAIVAGVPGLTAAVVLMGVGAMPVTEPSIHFPTRNPFQASYLGGEDGFVARVAGDLSEQTEPIASPDAVPANNAATSSPTLRYR